MGRARVRFIKPGDFPMTVATRLLEQTADRAGSALLLALSVVTAVAVLIVA